MGQPRLLIGMCVGSYMWLAGTMLHAFSELNGEHVIDSKVSFWGAVETLADVLWYFGYFVEDMMAVLKLYRVYKVTQFRRGQTILPRHILLPFLVGLIVPLVLFLASRIFERKHKILFQISLSIEILFPIPIFGFAWTLRSVEESIGDIRKTYRWVIYKLVLLSTHGVILFKTSVIDGDAKVETVDNKRKQLQMLFGYLPRFLIALGASIFFVFPRMYFFWHEQKHGRLPSRVQMFGTGNVHVTSSATTTATTTTTTTATATTTTTTNSAILSQQIVPTGNSAGNTVPSNDGNYENGKNGGDGKILVDENTGGTKDENVAEA